MLKMKWNSMMKQLCVWEIICRYSTCGLCCPYLYLYLEWMKKNRKTDANTMCDNTSFPFTQMACIPHCQIFLQWTTHTMIRVKQMQYQRIFGKLLWSDGNRSWNTKYHWVDISCSMKIKVKGTILKQCTVWYPINQWWLMLKVIH